jgi:hypothetical protein
MTIFVGGLLLLAAVLAWAGAGVIRASRRDPVTLNDLIWASEFDGQRYRVLERLANDSDFQWLRRQKGYRPVTASALRQRRVRTLRKFLREIEQDYARIHRVAQYLIAVSPEDRSEQALLLWQQHTKFVAGVQWIRGRLLLSEMGMGLVDLRSVMECLHTVASATRSLQPASVAAVC